MLVMGFNYCSFFSLCIPPPGIYSQNFQSSYFSLKDLSDYKSVSSKRCLFSYDS